MLGTRLTVGVCGGRLNISGVGISGCDGCGQVIGGWDKRSVGRNQI